MDNLTEGTVTTLDQVYLTLTLALREGGSSQERGEATLLTLSKSVETRKIRSVIALSLNPPEAVDGMICE